MSDKISKSERTAIVQDIVKVNLVTEDLASSITEQNTRPLALNTTYAIATELVAGNVILRFFNGADQNLIQCAIQKDRSYQSPAS